MQDQQSVEELGVQLQKLGRKPFLGSGHKEFDQMLKGHFFQALLPKWQRKLGALKTTKSFEDLYARAHTLEHLTSSLLQHKMTQCSRGEGASH